MSDSERFAREVQHVAVLIGAVSLSVLAAVIVRRAALSREVGGREALIAVGLFAVVGVVGSAMHWRYERRFTWLVAGALLSVALITLIGVETHWDHAVEVGRTGTIAEGFVWFGIPAGAGAAAALSLAWRYRVVPG